jgi:ABC-type dipeptide/oligopeptide/nickel transport system permease component
MAMKIGDQYPSQRVTPKDFEKLAEDAGLDKPLVKHRVSEIAEVLLETMLAIDAGNPAAEKVSSILRGRAETAMMSFDR